MKANKSILVVGAGPVGLTMAAELARHGIHCRIIDKAPAPSTYCRALGVTARTLEIWENMGILQQAMNAGIWLKGRIIDMPGQSAVHIQSDYSGLSFAGLSLPQYETERILTDHLRQFKISVERNISLSSIKTENGNITGTLTNEYGVSKVETFDYLIGCDGAHSTVRRLMNIGFEGEIMPYEFMLADVEIEWEIPRGIAYNALKPATDKAPDFFLAIPLPDAKRYRISTLSNEPLVASEQGSDHGIQSERPAPALSIFQEIANRLVSIPLKLSDVRWSSIFRISMRLAANYRKENIFLAGDAAHVHPPTGGQGMNTGIQDAYNLAWKLALVIRGIAKNSLLDSYEAERQEEGMNVINRTVAASMNFGKGGLMPDKLADAQMLVSYRNSAWVKNDNNTNEDSPLRAGDRAPDCKGLQRYGVGFTFRLFEIMSGNGFVLLVDCRPDLKEVISDLQPLIAILQNNFGKTYTDIFKIFLIGDIPESSAPDLGISFLFDKELQFSNAYYSTGGSAFLIRPDGYIGWKGVHVNSPGLQDFLNEILCNFSNQRVV